MKPIQLYIKYFRRRKGEYGNNYRRPLGGDWNKV